MTGWFQWLRRLFHRPQAPSPDVETFIAKQRESRADALKVQQASRKVTRNLERANPLEPIYLGRRTRHDS